jgi:hypothetical protein
MKAPYRMPMKAPYPQPSSVEGGDMAAEDHLAAHGVTYVPSKIVAYDLAT